jgi:hypothetical protein
MKNALDRRDVDTGPLAQEGAIPAADPVDVQIGLGNPAQGVQISDFQCGREG